MTTIEIKNIDDKIIWNKNSNQSFIAFAKRIYNENEILSGATEVKDIPAPITTTENALRYLEKYTELTINK